MEIRYKDILIRNADKDDASILASWWNDGSVMEHAGFPYGLGISEKQIIDSLKNDNDLYRRLIIEYDDKAIGEMNYKVIDNDTVQIGIKICDDNYQNRGIGKIILSMLIRELFNEGYVKIVLDTNPNNLKARHVYEQLGFKNIGTRIDCWIDQLGNKQSAVDYELTINDFIEYK